MFRETASQSVLAVASQSTPGGDVMLFTIAPAMKPVLIFGAVFLAITWAGVLRYGGK